MKKWLCIYHTNCADGFTAAWVVRKALGPDVDFYPGVYQEPPPDVKGRSVIVVDFSYKRAIMNKLRDEAERVIILDHHKSAREELWDLSGVTTVFDKKQSGARIAWDYYFPNTPHPQLLLHIEDRDLWKFSLKNTREIQAAVFSYPYDFGVWDLLMNHADLTQLTTQGEAIERKHLKDIHELLRVVTRRMVIGGYVVPVANLPYTLSSDAGHFLAKGEAFGACYWDTPQGRVFSLRSTDQGIDVSEVAKKYGGGGHRNASGFRLSFEEARKLEEV